MLQLILTISRVSRRRRPGRQDMRLLVMLVVTPIIPPRQPPCMEAHTRAIRPHLPLLLPGRSQRIHIPLPTSSPAGGITRHSRDTLLTQHRPQTHTDDRRHLPRPRTPPQVQQQPRQATTLRLMVVSIPSHNNHNHHETHNLALPGTVRDRSISSYGLVIVPASIYRARRYTHASQAIGVELWSLATLMF